MQLKSHASHAKKSPASPHVAPVSDSVGDSAATVQQRGGQTFGNAGAPNSALRRAIQLADQGDCQAALQLLRPQGHSPEIQNAIGVCLMRLGQIAEAVRIYHPLVMKSGCTWMRPEVPRLYKLNFATALLLSGTPAGCRSALRDIGAPGHMITLQLQNAIKEWEASLSFWRRWDWRINGIDPPRCRVQLSFSPGAFCDPQE